MSLLTLKLKFLGYRLNNKAENITPNIKLKKKIIINKKINKKEREKMAVLAIFYENLNGFNTL